MLEYNTLIKEKVLTVRDVDTTFKKAKISSSADAAEYARQFYHEDISIYESFFIILLSIQNNVMAYAKISQGGVAGTVVDSRIILKYAIDTLASALILIHNHPSGECEPSNNDMAITTKIKTGAEAIDIKLLDHIIVGDFKYFSFADEGLI